MRIAEISVDPEQTGPPGAASNPATAGPNSAQPDAISSSSNWLNFSPTGQGQEVQRNMESLAIDSLQTQRVSDLNSGSSYMNSEGSGSGSGGDAGLSPDTQHSNSGRPTPKSSTPSDSRSNLQTGQNGSSGTSYETSPASSHNNPLRRDGDHRIMESFFSGQPDFSNIPSTGLTPGNQFSMPETPGRDFGVPSGWEMNSQTNSLTPVGEGVLRQLMGLGPLDPM
jgi:hypothetical protein